MSEHPFVTDDWYSEPRDERLPPFVPQSVEDVHLRHSDTPLRVRRLDLGEGWLAKADHDRIKLYNTNRGPEVMPTRRMSQALKAAFLKPIGETLLQARWLFQTGRRPHEAKYGPWNERHTIEVDGAYGIGEDDAAHYDLV